MLYDTKKRGGAWGGGKYSRSSSWGVAAYWLFGWQSQTCWKTGKVHWHTFPPRLQLCICTSSELNSWRRCSSFQFLLVPCPKNPLIFIIFVFFFIIMGTQICNCLWLKITKWKHVNRCSVSWPSLKVQNVDQREEIRAHGKVPRKKWVNSMKKHRQFKPGLKPVIYVSYSKSASHQPLCDPWQNKKKVCALRLVINVYGGAALALVHGSLELDMAFRTLYF